VAGTYDLDGVTDVVAMGTVDFLGNARTGTATVSQATLAVSGSLTIAGAADWNNGAITGTGDVIVMGLLTCTQSTMNGGGRTEANGGMRINPGALGGGLQLMDGRTLDNAGAAIWTGGDISVYGGATMNNRVGATFDDQSTNWLVSYGTVTTFNNAGTFRRSGPSGQHSFGAAFLNTGTVDVETGTLSLGFGSSQTGSFQVQRGATLAFPGGYNLTGTSAVGGDGTVDFGGGTVHVAGIYDLAGTTAIDGGTADFLVGARTGALALSTGTLAGPGDLTVTGLLTWTGGTMSGSGRTVANGGMAVSGPAGKTLDGRALDNAGTATWTGGDIAMANGAVFNNLPGGTWDAQGDAGFVWNLVGVTPALNNAGTFRKSAGTGTTTVAVTFSNTGTVDVQTGTINLAGSFANYNVTTGTLTGGTYRVTGTLQFTDGNVLTNAAALVLDGPASRVVNQANVNALANLADNAATGSLAIQDGRNFTAAGGFHNTGSLTINSGSTFTAGGDYTQTDGATTLAGGTLAAGTVDLQGGLLAGTGTINANVVNAAQIQNGDAGTAGALTINGSYAQAAAGSLAVGPGSTVSLTGAFANFAAGTLTGGTYFLAGTFRFTGAQIVTNAAVIILDGPAAMIIDESGNDALAALAVNDAAGSLLLADGASLTTAGDFSNRGYLSVGPGSVLTVNGDYTQGSAATLEVQLGGTPDTGLFGQLRVRGTAALDGALVLTPVDGYVPGSGDAFPILTFGSRNGDFAIPPDGFDLHYDDLGGTLTVVAR
jgi:hypothetical protein